MIVQLLLGSALIAVTILIQAGFIATATNRLVNYGRRIDRSALMTKHLVIITAVTMWLMIGLTLAVWLWAIVFLMTGIFTDLETSVYFAIVSFTTLGFGDIILPIPWRLMSGLIATNGLILFGLSTAYLIEVMMRLKSDDR